MRRHQDRAAIAHEAVKDREQPFRSAGVQTGERLIRKQHDRPMQQGPRNRQSLQEPA